MGGCTVYWRESLQKPRGCGALAALRRLMVREQFQRFRAGRRQLVLATDRALANDRTMKRKRNDMKVSPMTKIMKSIGSGVLLSAAASALAS